MSREKRKATAKEGDADVEKPNGDAFQEARSKKAKGPEPLTLARAHQVRFPGDFIAKLANAFAEQQPKEDGPKSGWDKFKRNFTKAKKQKAKDGFRKDFEKKYAEMKQKNPNTPATDFIDDVIKELVGHESLVDIAKKEKANIEKTKERGLTLDEAIQTHLRALYRRENRRGQPQDWVVLPEGQPKAPVRIASEKSTLQDQYELNRKLWAPPQFQMSIFDVPDFPTGEKFYVQVQPGPKITINIPASILENPENAILAARALIDVLVAEILDEQKRENEKNKEKPSEFEPLTLALDLGKPEDKTSLSGSKDFIRGVHIALAELSEQGIVDLDGTFAASENLQRVDQFLEMERSALARTPRR